ncbi:MAG: hypothetical protein AAGC44_15185 [Planctomycetota bacterium]
MPSVVVVGLLVIQPAVVGPGCRQGLGWVGQGVVGQNLERGVGIGLADLGVGQERQLGVRVPGQGGRHRHRHAGPSEVGDVGLSQSVEV